MREMKLMWYSVGRMAEMDVRDALDARVRPDAPMNGDNDDGITVYMAIDEELGAAGESESEEDANWPMGRREDDDTT